MSPGTVDLSFGAFKSAWLALNHRQPDGHWRPPQCKDPIGVAVVDETITGYGPFDHLVPDADLGGIPSAGSLTYVIKVLCGPVRNARRRRKWRPRDMRPRGVWVQPYTFPCPLFERLIIDGRR